MALRLPDLSRLKHSMVRTPGHDFEADRRLEYIEFWGVTEDILEAREQTAQFSSPSFKENLHALFPPGEMASDEGLFACYRRAAEQYALRHMLGRCNKVDMMYPVLESIAARWPGGIEGRLGYDYGVGVGDITIALSILGATMRACDLDTRLLDFCVWRCAQRGIRLEAERLRPPCLYPQTADPPCDFLVCREVLEHIRDPLRAIRFIAGIVKPGGVFYTSSLWPGSTREIGGTHLAVAAKTAASNLYADTFHDHFAPTRHRGLYVRRGDLSC